tara:strand:- start:395 stop:1813 length:1419 start_codon:yes stop_codon:yes gene_type:complete
MMHEMIYQYPRGAGVECKYIVDWVFGEIFGMTIECNESEGENHRLQLVGDLQSELNLTDVFFFLTQDEWLSEECLPGTPLPVVPLADFLPECIESTGQTDIPILYGNKNISRGLYQQNGGKGTLEIDIVGSLFFLMSRYEEAVLDESDEHDRFPSSASILGKSGLLDRAIGNEYIEILWAAMKRVWPELVRKPREFRILPSHDIDYPSSYWGQTAVGHLRVAAGAMKRGSPLMGIKHLWNALRYPKIDWSSDPVETIDWIMDLSERCGLKSAFYYIPEQTDETRDFGMPIDHPQVEAQWRRIHGRGHEIGLHPGYQTCNQAESIQGAALVLRRQMKKLGIEQNVLGGRQHYLRWDPLKTASAWEASGMDYDSSMAFASECGFRCGICYEFPMYDLAARRPLKLRQRPLVLMECSLTDEKYMGKGTGDVAFATALKLKKECQKYNGDFTILWHNQRLVKKEERELYARILTEE